MKTWQTPPVLFLIFNRPDFTGQVFSAIRAARPARLYIAADGPRPDRPEDFRNCAQCRLIAQQVDWPCKLKLRFLEQNYGCRSAVSSAIGWFFGEEKSGIVLEDDCLPAPEFFRFCAEALDRYRDDGRVMHINGTVHESPVLAESDVWFSRYALVWGWASWRRAWQFYDSTLYQYPFERLATFFPDPEVRERWDELLRNVRDERPGFDSWAFSWSASLFARSAVAVSPVCNLVRNLGTGPGGGTHRIAPALARSWSSQIPFRDRSVNFSVPGPPDDDADSRIFQRVYRRPGWFTRLSGKIRNFLDVGWVSCRFCM